MHISRKKLIDLLFFLTNIFLSFVYLKTEGITSDIRLIISAALLCLAYFIIAFKQLYRQRNSTLYKILGLCVFFMLLRGIVYETFGIGVFLNMVLATIVGTVIAANHINNLFQLIYMIASHLYVAYSYFTGILPSEIFAYRSYNHISVLILYSTIIYYISNDSESLKKRKYSILPSVSCFAICLFSVGRSGVLSALLLLTLLVFHKYIQPSFESGLHRTRKILFSLAIVYPIFLVGIKVYNYGNKLDLFARFNEKQLASGERLYMLVQYFSNLKPLGILIGNSSGYFEQTFSLSAHITFMGWHNMFGMASLLLVVYVLYIFFRYFFYNQVYMFMMSVILFRSLTDELLFTGGDMFTILLVFFLLSLESAHDSYLNQISLAPKS